MTTLLQLPIELRHYQRYSYHIRIMVVGCGGTGGYLIPNLARLIASQTERTLELTLLDGDVVERKNLKRQNFIAADLGKPKAQVLAERYSAALGITIGYKNSYLKDPSILEELSDPSHRMGTTIVMGCVDNHRTRQIIAQWFRKHPGRFWIDAGNEEMHGQVVCGFHYYPYRSDFSTFALPCVADLFEEIDADNKAMFNDELSCAERAIENPQNIATNILAANYLLSFAQQVIMGKPLSAHGIFFSVDLPTTDVMLNLAEKIDTQTWKGYQGPTQWTEQAILLEQQYEQAQ